MLLVNMFFFTILMRATKLHGIYHGLFDCAHFIYN